jgi:hypothetical protein
LVDTDILFRENAAPDTLSAPWTVNTNKNLTISPMFYLNLFLEGQTTSLTNSHYFNITAKSTTTTTSISLDFGWNFLVIFSFPLLCSG